MYCASAEWHDSCESCLAEGHPTLFLVQTLDSVLCFTTCDGVFTISAPEWAAFIYNQVNLIIVLLLLNLDPNTLVDLVISVRSFTFVSSVLKSSNRLLRNSCSSASFRTKDLTKLKSVIQIE